MIKGRRTFGVVFPIFKGRQLRIHCSDSERSFSKKRISVIQMVQMAHREDPFGHDITPLNIEMIMLSLHSVFFLWQDNLTVGEMPEGRFILALVGMLSADHGSHSVSLLINSGVMALCDTLLSLTGCDVLNSAPVSSVV